MDCVPMNDDMDLQGYFWIIATMFFYKAIADAINQLMYAASCFKTGKSTVVNKVETTVRLSSATLRAFSCSVSAWLKMLFYANKAVSINEADFWEMSYLLRQKLLVPLLAYL